MTRLIDADLRWRRAGYSRWRKQAVKIRALLEELNKLPTLTMQNVNTMHKLKTELKNIESHMRAK